MDVSQDNTEEDSKYAFLLGSALREEDFEQVLKIYDDLIPKFISSERLSQIKEGARLVSELPEDEFNHLVLNARTFSLASARSNMNHNSGGRAVVPPLLGISDMESNNDHCDVLGGSGDHCRDQQPHYSPLQSKCRQMADSKVSELNTHLELRNKFGGNEDDSGLPDSLRATSGKTSVSNHTMSSMDDEEEVDSGDDRGVFDYTQQQCRPQHVRITPSLNPPYDEEIKVCSSAGGSSVDSPRSENSLATDEYNLTGLDDEEGTRLKTLHREEHPYRVLQEDDENFGFVNEHKFLYGRHQQDGARRDREYWHYTASKHSDNDPDDVEMGTSKHSFHKPSSSRQQSSQFDDRINLLKPSPNVFYSYNMFGDNGADTAGSKKDKRKGRSKDDSDKPEHYDVNGNPKIPLENYSQMRQSPGGHKSDAGSYLAISSANHSIQEQNELDRKLERRRKKREKQQLPTASRETIKDFKGELPVDHLLAFIEGNKQAPSDAQGAKSGKKKHKVLNGQLSSDGKTGSKKQDVGGSTKDNPVNKSKQSAMDNTTGHCDTEENHTHHEGSNSTPEESQTSQKKDSKLSDKKSKSHLDDSKIQGDSLKASKNKSTGKKEFLNGPTSPTHVFKQKQQSEIQNSAPQTFSHDYYSKYYSDIDYVKKEETFTEVKKKKKRPTVKENLPNSGTNNGPAYNGSSSFYQNRSNGNSYRNTHRPRATSPPPESLQKNDEPQTSLPNNSPVQSRDLSPSAFPKLRADGRRNSCGDISAEAVDNKVLYDSDRESVKSLPVAQPGNVDVAYPTMSYARMAAAPKRGYDGINSPSSESGVVSGSHNSSVSSSVLHTPGSSTDINSPQSPSDNPVAGTPERKNTVWKGSPRERRHSIGSSPEDMVENDKSSISQRNRQKSGSQEILNRDGLAGSTATAAPIKNILGDDILNKERVMETDKDKDNNLDAALDSVPPQERPEMQSEPTCAETAAVQLEKTVRNSSKEKDSIPLSVSIPTVVQTEESNKCSSIVSPNTATSKSVVFMDKRFDTKPRQNLGISFGFDDKLCSSPASPSGSSQVMPKLQQAHGQQKPSHVIPSSKSQSSYQPPISKKAVPATPTTQGTSESLATHSHIPTLPSASLSQFPPLQSTSPSSRTITQRPSDNANKSNKVPKGPNTPGPCNGLVPTPALVVDSSSQKAPVVSSNNSNNDNSHSSISGVVNGAQRTSKHSIHVPTPMASVPRPHNQVGSVISSGGIVFSPHHPPPPLPTQNSSKVPAYPVTTVDLSKGKNEQPIKTKNNALVSPQPVSQSTKSGLPVIYGQKIKDGGCGKLMFMPLHPKERSRTCEASGFLRKKWSDISRDPPNKNSPVFITMKQD